MKPDDVKLESYPTGGYAVYCRDASVGIYRRRQDAEAVYNALRASLAPENSKGD